MRHESEIDSIVTDISGSLTPNQFDFVILSQSMLNLSLRDSEKKNTCNHTVTNTLTHTQIHTQTHKLRPIGNGFRKTNGFQSEMQSNALSACCFCACDQRQLYNFN